MRETTKDSIPVIFFIVLALAIFWPDHVKCANTSAGCAIDMGISTRGYVQGSISETDIEHGIVASAEDQISLLIVAQDVTNLDTFQVEILFDSTRLDFIAGYLEDAFGGIDNFLKKEGGNPIGFQATERSPGIVNVSCALSGNDPDMAPDGSGVLGILVFQLLTDDCRIELTLSEVYYIDTDGGGENPPVSDTITNFMDAEINPQLKSAKRIFVAKTSQECAAISECHMACVNTFQEVIDLAPEDGTEVEIMPGTYEEQLVADRPITFIVENGEVIIR